MGWAYGAFFTEVDYRPNYEGGDFAKNATTGLTNLHLDGVVMWCILTMGLIIGSPCGALFTKLTTETMGWVLCVYFSEIKYRTKGLLFCCSCIFLLKICRPN